MVCQVCMLGLNTTTLYKKFDLGISLRGAFGFEVLNEYRMHWETMKRISEGNLPKSVLKNLSGASLMFLILICTIAIMLRRETM